MSTFKEVVSNKWVILVGIGLIAFIFIGYYFGTYNPQNELVTKIVNEQLKIEKDKYDLDVKKYESDKKALEAKNRELENKLVVSQSQYSSTKIELEILKGKKNDIKPPQNVTESRKRLLLRGYSTF